MADPRTLATALAPFQRSRDVLRAADARLAGLLASCAREGVTRIERLSRLPAAAQFTPFDALSAQAAPADANASTATAQGVGGRPRRPSASTATGSAADRQPASAGSTLPAASAGAAGSVRQVLASVPGADPGPIAGLAPGATMARAINTDAPPHTDTPRSGRGTATPPAGDIDHATVARDAGELIGELLQRHAAPRRPPRLQGIGARPDAAQALAGADDAAARQAPSLGAPPAATSPERGQRSSVSWAQPAPADDTRARAPRDLGSDAPSSRDVRAAQRPPATGTAMDRRAPASLLQSGSDTLRALVSPLFLRPASGFDAASATGAATSRSTDHSPLLRAPSRLLGATNPGIAAAAPTAGTQTATATPAFAATAPAVSMPADNAADLAAGLERLLREQAWLRGVDLT